MNQQYIFQFDNRQYNKPIVTTKIISWNVNGIRAAVKKDFVESMNKVNADIICLQETKAQPDEVELALEKMQGYHLFSNSAEKKGYAGTAILSREEPLSVKLDMGVKMHDNEGRILTAEYSDYYLVTVYVPNSKRGLLRIDERMNWDQAFLKFLKNLEKTKPVIVCGDLNVAHQPMDLARPKSNYNKTAGYTQREIDGFETFLNKGFFDAFRTLYPEEVAYSWWSYMFNARKKNLGWRIDYFLCSKALQSRVRSTSMLSDVLGSDHCPIDLMIE